MSRKPVGQGAACGQQPAASGRPLPSGVVRIGLVQSACKPDREANIQQALSGIAEAARLGADVVCLQELFAGEYPCQAEEHEKFAEAEVVPGPLTERVAAAAKAHGVVVVASVFERARPACSTTHA